MLLEDEAMQLYLSMRLESYWQLPEELDNFVLQYCGWAVVVGFEQMTTVLPNVSCVKKMWTTPKGSLILETGLLMEQNEESESDPCHITFWQMHPAPSAQHPELPRKKSRVAHSCWRYLSPAVLLQECGNRGAAVVTQDGFGQTLRFYNEEKTGPIADECKVVEVDSGRELKKACEIGWVCFAKGNVWATHGKIDFTVHRDLRSLNGSRHGSMMPIRFQPSLWCDMKHPNFYKDHSNDSSRPMMGFIRERCNADGSVVAAIIGHPMFPEERFKTHTNRLPCAATVWTRMENGEYAMHPPMALGLGFPLVPSREQDKFMGFLDFLSNEYLLISVFESVFCAGKTGWIGHFRLVNVSPVGLELVFQTRLTFMVNTELWNLQTMTARWEKNRGIQILVAFLQKQEKIFVIS